MCFAVKTRGMESEGSQAAWARLLRPSVYHCQAFLSHLTLPPPLRLPLSHSQLDIALDHAKIYRLLGKGVTEHIADKNGLYNTN